MVMVSININQETLQKLKEQAEREQKSVEEVISATIEEVYGKTETEYDETTDSLVLLAKLSDEMDIRSDHNDVAENSRDLIGKAIADHHRERTQQDENPNRQ